MKPINKDSLIRNTVITLFTSWLTWICLWPSACNDSKPVKSNQSDFLKTDHVALLTTYHQKINALKSKEDSLMRELSATQKKLLAYRKESLKNKTIVQQRISNRPSDTLLLVADCDSLRNEVRVYIQSVEQEDSLQQQTINQQQEVITVKDSTLDVCQQSFSSLSQLTEQSINHAQDLEKQLQKTQKKVKRNALLNRILTGTTLALAGATAILIIR